MFDSSNKSANLWSGGVRLERVGVTRKSARDKYKMGVKVKQKDSKLSRYVRIARGLEGKGTGHERNMGRVRELL